MRQFERFIGIFGITALACLAVAGPEASVPEVPAPSALGSAEGPIHIQHNAEVTPVAGIPYYEYFNYSSYAKHSYVPGYTPHVSSLYENPRDYPWSLGALATPYTRFAGVPGWYFGSPQGYQSSVPKGSHVSKYFRGELEITKDLRGGYPQGMRVVEPAIVPVGASVEKGGIYIHGGGSQTVQVGRLDEVIKESARTLSAPPPPMAMPRPAPTPASLEK